LLKNKKPSEIAIAKHTYRYSILATVSNITDLNSLEKNNFHTCMGFTRWHIIFEKIEVSLFERKVLLFI